MACVGADYFLVSQFSSTLKKKLYIADSYGPLHLTRRRATWKGGGVKKELGYEAVSTRNTSRITFQYVPPPLNTFISMLQRCVFIRYPWPLVQCIGVGLPVNSRAFQFGQKRFDSIRSDFHYRIDFFDSIGFGNLINLPLVHWYLSSKLGVIFIVCIA